jgi:hypothetical protein
LLQQLSKIKKSKEWCFFYIMRSSLALS